MTKAPDKRALDPAKPDISSREELNRFLGGLTRVYIDNQHEEKEKQDETVREYLQQFDRKTRQQLMGRAYVDALKSPHQKLGTAKPPSDDPAVKGDKPAADDSKKSAD